MAEVVQARVWYGEFRVVELVDSGQARDNLVGIERHTLRGSVRFEPAAHYLAVGRCDYRLGFWNLNNHDGLAGPAFDTLLVESERCYSSGYGRDGLVGNESGELCRVRVCLVYPCRGSVVFDTHVELPAVCVAERHHGIDELGIGQPFEVTLKLDFEGFPLWYPALTHIAPIRKFCLGRL